MMSDMKSIVFTTISFNLIMILAVYGEEISEFVLAKKQMLDELADCTASITDLADDRVDASVISIRDILSTLNTLDTLVEDELTYYRGLLENLTTASIYDLNLRHTTLQQIDEVADVILQESQCQQYNRSCVSQQSFGRNEVVNYAQWREPEIVKGFRHDSWPQGVYRYSNFNACPNLSQCFFIHMVVLPDGSIAVSDAENYEIRLFSMKGVLLRKISVLPLEPRYMAHFQGFKIFVRMKNLNGNYIIAEVDLWKMTIRTVIEFLENFNYWEYACASPFTVVNNVIFVGCTPFLFMYDVNGTRLSNFSTFERQRIVVFHSEKGSERIFLDTPPMTGMIPNRTTVIDFWNGPLCSPQNFFRPITGAMSANNTFYAVNERERFRVKRYGPNCEPEGTVIEINNRSRFVTLAVFGELLVAQVKRGWMSRNNNFKIQVFKLGG